MQVPDGWEPSSDEAQGWADIIARRALTKFGIDCSALADADWDELWYGFQPYVAVYGEWNLRGALELADAWFRKYKAKTDMGNQGE